MATLTTVQDHPPADTMKDLYQNAPGVNGGVRFLFAGVSGVPLTTLSVAPPPTPVWGVAK